MDQSFWNRGDKGSRTQVQNGVSGLGSPIPRSSNSKMDTGFDSRTVENRLKGLGPDERSQKVIVDHDLRIVVRGTRRVLWRVLGGFGICRIVTPRVRATCRIHTSNRDGEPPTHWNRFVGWVVRS